MSPPLFFPSSRSPSSSSSGKTKQSLSFPFSSQTPPSHPFSSLHKNMVSNSYHRNNSVLYKEMLSKSKAFRESLELVSKQALEFSNALSEWNANVSPSSSLQDTVAIQKYAEHLNLISNGFSLLSEWLQSSFAPQLDSNAQFHSISVKASLEKYKLTQQLLTKTQKQLSNPSSSSSNPEVHYPSPPHSTSSTLTPVNSFSNTYTQLQGLQHQYMVSMLQEEKRHVQFVNEKFMDRLIIETHFVWNPLIEQIRASIQQFQSTNLLPTDIKQETTRMVPEDSLKEKQGTVSVAFTEDGSFFSCVTYT